MSPQQQWAKENPEKIRAARRRYYARNKEKIHAERRAYRAKNREKLDAAKRAWEAANPDVVSMQRARRRLKAMNSALNRSLQYHYEVTKENYEAVLQAQGGVCAICRRLEVTARTKRLVVDHDHKTGALRALLCHRCNCALGYFKDDIALFIRAVSYLEGFHVEQSGDWLFKVRAVLAHLSKKGGEEGRAKGVDADPAERRTNAADRHGCRESQEAGTVEA